MAFKNKQGITKIKITHTVRCFCPMGNDWYSAEVLMTVKNPKFIPDYCDVEHFLRKKVDGRELILEDVCVKVYKYLRRQTKHGKIKVAVHSNDAVHPPVTVEKFDF